MEFMCGLIVDQNASKAFARLPWRIRSEPVLRCTVSHQVFGFVRDSPGTGEQPLERAVKIQNGKQPLVAGKERVIPLERFAARKHPVKNVFCLCAPGVSRVDDRKGKAALRCSGVPQVLLPRVGRYRLGLCQTFIARTDSRGARPSVRLYI